MRQNGADIRRSALLITCMVGLLGLLLGMMILMGWHITRIAASHGRIPLVTTANIWRAWEMSKYKVGDRVRILHTDYNNCGLDVGTIHEVKYVNSYGIDLLGIGPENKDDPLYFTHWEVEPAPAPRFELEKTYKTREHGEYTCIHVADNGKAWLVSGDSPAYVWDADGRSISLTPEWDVVFGPVVEWASLNVAIVKDNDGKLWSGHLEGDNRPYTDANYVNLSFPLIDGTPDFTQAKVTPCT